MQLFISKYACLPRPSTYAPQPPPGNGNGDSSSGGTAGSSVNSTASNSGSAASNAGNKDNNSPSTTSSCNNTVASGAGAEGGDPGCAGGDGNSQVSADKKCPTKAPVSCCGSGWCVVSLPLLKVVRVPSGQSFAPFWRSVLSRFYGAVRFYMCLKKIRTHLDLLSIPRLWGKNVKTFRWDQRLQIQNLFMAFKQVP